MKTNYRGLKLLLWHLLIIGVIFGAFYHLSRHEVLLVNSIALNVRTGPGLDHEIQAQAKKGDQLKVLKKQNDWYQVELPTQETGWIAGWLVDSKSTSGNNNIAATINTQDTPLRKEPNSDSDVLMTLKKNAAVIVTSERNGWSTIEYEDQTGWIDSKLVTITDDDSDSFENTEVFARENQTNIRKMPDASSELVTRISYGETLKLLKVEGDWYHVETTNGKVGYVASWVVSFRDPSLTQEATTSIAESIIMLDPGHGGEDSGAESAHHDQEKALALSTAKQIKKQLEKTGAKVILTRSKDETVSLKQRVDMSNHIKPDIFISLHYDSTEDENTASGTTTYYYDKQRDLKLAKTVNQYLKDELPLKNRGYEYNDLYVTRENSQPALLLELGYLNNKNDAKYAITSSYQKKVATAITKALTDYFK